MVPVVRYGRQRAGATRVSEFQHRSSGALRTFLSASSWIPIAQSPIACVLSGAHVHHSPHPPAPLPRLEASKGRARESLQSFSTARTHAPLALANSFRLFEKKNVTEIEHTMFFDEVVGGIVRCAPSISVFVHFYRTNAFFSSRYPNLGYSVFLSLRAPFVARRK